MLTAHAAQIVMLAKCYGAIFTIQMMKQVLYVL